MLRAVLVDDSADLRTLTRFTLELDGDAEVVGEAADGLSGLELIESLSPDVAVIDLNLPGISGLELIQFLRERNVSVTRLVAYSADDRALQDALGRGADAAVRKTASLTDLLAAITALDP
jgi:DNA-binding NarL/FixJ family response regulator